MEEETRKLLSYIRKTTGKYELNETELINLLSIRNNYLKPDEVKEFIRIAVKKGYAKLDNGKFTIRVSADEFEPDLNYFPNMDKIRMENEDVDIFTEAMRRILEKTHMSKNQVVIEINKMKESNPFLYPDVAILYVAKKNGINIDDLMEKARRNIIS